MVSPTLTPPPLGGPGYHAVVGKPLSAPDLLHHVRSLVGAPDGAA
jgi:hypothetical protein